MIPETEFEDEIAGYVAIFIKASKALDDAAIDSQGKGCARLITRLARVTTFEGETDGDDAKAAEAHGEDAGREGGQTGGGSPGSG